MDSLLRLSFSRFANISRSQRSRSRSRFDGACVITLGRASVVAYVEPGSGARYGGGGEERCFSVDDDTDISIGLSMPL